MKNDVKIKRRRIAGVTLIELLTVIVVIAILSSISVASYRRYGLRANRTDATTTLLRIQVGEEKHFLSNQTYTQDFITSPSVLPNPGLGVLTSATTNGGYYNIAIAPGAGGIGTSYVATASAIGGQTDDTNCQTLSVNDQGAKTSSPGLPTECWK